MSNEYKLVPVEPTEEMIYWIATAAHRGDSGAQIWSEALDYAPQPPALGGGAIIRYCLDATDGRRAEMREDPDGHYCEYSHLAPLQAEIERLTDSLANHDSVSKAMGAWVAEKGQMPWATAIKTFAILTRMPDEERDRLLDMDDGSTERGALIEERDQIKAQRDDLEPLTDQLKSAYEFLTLCRNDKSDTAIEVGAMRDACEWLMVAAENLGATLSKPAGGDTTITDFGPEHTWTCGNCKTEQPADQDCDVCNGSTKPADNMDLTALPDMPMSDFLEANCAQPADQQGEPFAFTTTGMLAIAEDIQKHEYGVGRIGARLDRTERFCVPLYRHPQPAAAKVDERLIEATAFVQKLRDSAAGQPSVATGYLSDILDVLQEGRAKLNTPQ